MALANNYYFGVTSHEAKKITCVVTTDTEEDAWAKLASSFEKEGGYASAVLVMVKETPYHLA
jgi:thioester reductase-like protein